VTVETQRQPFTLSSKNSEQQHELKRIPTPTVSARRKRSASALPRRPCAAGEKTGGGPGGILRSHRDIFEPEAGQGDHAANLIEATNAGSSAGTKMNAETGRETCTADTPLAAAMSRSSRFARDVGRAPEAVIWGKPATPST